MSVPTTKPASMSEDQFAAANSILDELDLLEEIEAVTSDVSTESEDVVEEIEPDDLADLDLIASAISEVERDEARKEAYENQASNTPAPDFDAVNAPKTATKKERKAKAAGTSTPRSSTPRVARDISSVSDEFFKLDTTDAADAASIRIATMALMPKQKKVAEKFENIFIGLSTGGRISTFTLDAYKLLKEKGTMTSADLVACYKADGYEEGTARAQCGQMMNLFDTLAIAKRTGSSLTLNANSALAERLDDYLSKKAAPAAP